MPRRLPRPLPRPTHTTKLTAYTEFRTLPDRGLEDGDRFLRAAAQVKRPADDLARAAVDDRVQVAPALLGDPDRGHVHVPELPRPLDPEEAGPPAARDRAAALDQALLAHHPQHPFAVNRNAELAPRERPDHPVAVGRVLLGDLDDRLLDRTPRRPPLWRAARLRPPVERLAADLRDARHGRRRVALGDELTRAGDALSHSHSRNSFPAISNS